MAKNILRCDVTEYVTKTPPEEIFVEFSIDENCMSIDLTDIKGNLLKHTEIEKFDAKQLANFILNNQ
jgi:hypothetical protein